MDGLFSLLLFALFFYVMMRFGCGAHMVHGHGGHGDRDGHGAASLRVGGERFGPRLAEASGLLCRAPTRHKGRRQILERPAVRSVSTPTALRPAQR